MSGTEWSVTRVLVPLRKKLEGFFSGLDAQEQLDYVRLQKAYLNAQTTFEAAIRQLGADLETTSLGALSAGLEKLAGKAIDPKSARIHTRYLKPADIRTQPDPLLRVRRAIDSGVDNVAVSSVTLWDAACMNYGGLTGWGFPGNVSLEEASYLDPNVGISAADFIALVRKLNIGAKVRASLNEALSAPSQLGGQVLALATAELQFALIEAFRTANKSGVNQERYRAVTRAMSGEGAWDYTEEVKMFIPHGRGNEGGGAGYGLLGIYQNLPKGDYLSVAHVIFSVKACKGAFSYFPNRPGGALRHYDSFSQAAKDFHVAFNAFYSRKELGWLYQAMALSDYARLMATLVKERPPEGLNVVAGFLYRLFGRAPELNEVKHIGYRRESVENAPVISLCRFYTERSKANLKTLAHETPGLMPTLLEIFQTLFNEIISLLLIPVPGPLKGLGRLRAFGMFASLGQTLFEGLQKGERADLVQVALDVADLLSSRFLHARLAPAVKRRHEALYQRLVQQSKPLTVPERQSQTDAQLLEKMIGAVDAPLPKLESALKTSNSARDALDQVWEGAQPSASLVEAVHRFNVDRLIDWATEGADSNAAEAVGAVGILAPLFTQLKDWPSDTSLSIENSQGLEVRRYSKSSARQTRTVVRVTMLEGDVFAYATPRRITAQLPRAIADLLPGFFSSSKLNELAQQLADKAKALRIDLFDALTTYANVTRAGAIGAPESVRSLLPDSVVNDPHVPAVIEQLQTLHPQLSQARLLEVLRLHPLSAHQQTQLLYSQLQPEALYTALRNARQVARREAIVDGVFHPRRFDQNTQNWAAEHAPGVLRDLTGQALVVSPQAQAVPYVSRGARDKTVVVIDHGTGRFSLYNHQASILAESFSGADGFYQAVVSQIPESALSRLGWNAQRAITEFRHAAARALLSNRAPDGRFYPSLREVGQYVSAVDTAGIAAEPDALGLYALGEDRYVFIEGEYFQVALEHGREAWRIQHPSLEQAYEPVLIHNGAGAWRHEWENPLTWDGQKPFYRLGPIARALPPDAIAQIQRISGVTPAILRRVHMRNERPPAILRETVERFTIHQRVKSGMEVGRDFYDELLGEIGPEPADVLVGVAGASRADQVTVLESKVDIDKPQMERLFFKALCHKSEASLDPLAQVLQRDFPSLTAAVAESLVDQASADEVQSLEAGRVPLALTGSIRWWVKQLRRVRAIEGVYLPAAANQDSAKLILHTLPDIAGWPRHMRVEVWERGLLIDSIGPADGGLKRILEPVAGHYQAYIPQSDASRRAVGAPGAFLSVLLGALPPLDRQAIGYTHKGGVEELMEEIGYRQEHAGDSVDALLGIEHPAWFNPPRRVSDGRIAYPLSGGEKLGPTDRAQVARLRELFPAKTDLEAFELLANLSDSVKERGEAIDTLFRERDALNGVLSLWSAQAGSAARQAARSEAAELIRRCWRKENSPRGVNHELYLDDLALDALPLMNAYFGHVTHLSLRNNQLQGLPSNFLRQFPALRRLFLDGNRLEHLPERLSELLYLKQLNLSNNLIRPNLLDTMRLQDLTRLTVLDLSYNPLSKGRRLILYGLKALQVLKLRNTQINLLPQGATTLRKLRDFDLRDNRFKVLTEDDLYINENVHRAMNLHGNELSQATLQLLSRYRKRQGYQNVDFGLWHEGVFPLPSVERWLVPVPLNEVPRWRDEWTVLAGKQMADQFFNLLWNLSSFPPLIAPEHQALRQNVTQRVWQVIEGANHNGRLQQILFQTSWRYMSGGMDGWLLCLNEIELRMLPVQMLAGNVEAAGADFVNYYRALRRLASIEHHLFRDFPHQLAREACARILIYRIALAPSLDLPLALPGRFDSATATPSPQSVNELRQRILREESHLNWPLRLESEEYWVEFLERRYPQRFDATLKPFRRALELATEKVGNGGMTEWAYKNYIDILNVPMRQAKAELIRDLTLTEWTDFVNA